VIRTTTDPCGEAVYLPPKPTRLETLGALRALRDAVATRGWPERYERAVMRDGEPRVENVVLARADDVLRRAGV
jgi:hypothetical protein